MTPYREIEPAANWGLHVWAPNLPQLFVDAARGMFHLAGCASAPAGPAKQPPLERARAIELSAGNAESLLVAWLQELLAVSEGEGVSFDDFAVESLSPTHLRGRGWSWPSARPEKVIKAVTGRNLAIRRVDGGYTVALVFDV